MVKQKQIDKNYYIVSEKWQLEKLNNFFSENKLNITPITSRNIEQIVSNCDVNTYAEKDTSFILYDSLGNDILFRFSKKQIERNIFIVPYIFFKYENPLWYYHLYNKITEFGDVYYLNYKSIEERRTEMFKTLYEKQEKYRLKHKDRFWFTNIEFPGTEIIDEDTEEIIKSFDTVSTERNNEDKEKRMKQHKRLQEYFVDTFKVKSDFNRKTSEKDITEIDESNINKENDYEPVSKEKFKIKFSNGDSKEVGEYERFAVKKSNDYTLIYAKDLASNNELIEDWNLNLREILMTLGDYQIFTTEIDEINDASKLWQVWLSGLYEYYKIDRKTNKKLSDVEALKKLYDRLSLSITIQTMKNWIENKEVNFFPRSNNDLQSIIDIKLRLTPENNDENIAKKEKYKQQAENIKKGSTSLLYEIKRELTIYVCDKRKGKALTVLNQNHLNQFLRKKQINKIENIQKI